MSYEYKEKLRFMADVGNGDEHETALVQVFKAGKLVGISIDQSTEPGLIATEGYDRLYLPLDSLGEVGALIYEALEVK